MVLFGEQDSTTTTTTLIPGTTTSTTTLIPGTSTTTLIQMGDMGAKQMKCLSSASPAHSPKEEYVEAQFASVDSQPAEECVKPQSVEPGEPRSDKSELTEKKRDAGGEAVLCGLRLDQSTEETLDLKRELLRHKQEARHIQAIKSELKRKLSERDKLMSEYEQQLGKRERLLQKLEDSQHIKSHDVSRTRSFRDENMGYSNSVAPRSGPLIQHTAPGEELQLVREALRSLRDNFSEIAHSHSSPGLNSAVCTKVLYFTDRSLTPFLINIPKRLGEVTLRDFKAAVDRHGSYRYHFKALDPEFGT
ncbi:hypothetical protein CRUP_027146, partial [Coryphaenoides rupestris]